VIFTMKNKNIIVLLQDAYAAELETVANYLANSVWLDGLGAEEVKESLDEDIAEELGHAKQLAQRIKQLGGRPPGSLALPRTQKSLQPPKDSTDLRSVIKGVIAAEEGAIAAYKKIIKACDGTDYVTQDLAVRLLADEEEHCCLFTGFLKSLGKR
jgi:bacterioferritin